MEDKTKDLIPKVEISPSFNTPQEKIKTIKRQLEKTTEFREFPDGVQYNIEGPLLPINPYTKEGQWLGVLNVEGVGTNMVTLDYHPTGEGGKEFIIKIGDDVTIEGDVDIKDVAEFLPPLFAHFNKYGHFTRNEDAIHLGATKNLLFYNRVTGIYNSAPPRIKQKV